MLSTSPARNATRVNMAEHVHASCTGYCFRALLFATSLISTACSQTVLPRSDSTSTSSTFRQIGISFVGGLQESSGLSETAISSAIDEEGFIYTLVRAKEARGEEKNLLYKVSSSNLELVWTKDLGVGATPQGICVSEKSSTGEIAAFVVLTRTNSETRQSEGVVLRIRQVQRQSSPPTSDEIYKARSSENHTQLRDCVTGADVEGSFLYVAGGTTGNLFRSVTETESNESQLVLAKMTFSGSNIQGSQVGLRGKDIYGACISFNKFLKSKEVLIAAHVEDSKSTTSALYRFTSQSLTLVNNPAVLSSFGHVTPKSVAVSPKFVPSTNTSVVFVAGTARIAADKGNDIMCNFHSRYGNQSESFPIYVDGAGVAKLNNYGAGVKGGLDGNAYLGGYSIYTSEGNQVALSTDRPLLTVISPTGQTLFARELHLPVNVSQKVVSLEMLEGENGARKVLLIGNSPTKNQNASDASRISITGFELFRGAIAEFDGFGNIIDSAAAGETDKASQEKLDTNPSGQKNLLPIIAGGAGGLIVILGGIGLLVISGRKSRPIRRSQPHGTDGVLS